MSRIIEKVYKVNKIVAVIVVEPCEQKVLSNVSVCEIRKGRCGVSETFYQKR